MEFIHLMDIEIKFSRSQITEKLELLGYSKQQIKTIMGGLFNKRKYQKACQIISLEKKGILNKCISDNVCIVEIVG